MSNSSGPSHGRSQLSSSGTASSSMPPSAVVKPESGDETSTTKPPSRKKRRTLGTFPCSHCDKIFSRSDHLARHNLNHEPKEVFKCDFLMEDYNGSKKLCGKTFVRRDLKERHIRRHLEILDAKPLDPVLMKEYEKNLQLKHEHEHEHGLNHDDDDDDVDVDVDEDDNNHEHHPLPHAPAKKRKSVTKHITTNTTTTANNHNGSYSATSSAINSPSQTNGHLLQISNLIHDNEDNKNIDTSLATNKLSRKTSLSNSTITTPIANKTNNQSPFGLMPIPDYTGSVSTVPYPLFNPNNIPTPNLSSMGLTMPTPNASFPLPLQASPTSSIPVLPPSATQVNVPLQQSQTQSQSQPQPQSQSQFQATQQQPSISEQQSQSNLNDFYNQPLMNFTKNLPQTQNDILSWLFNENTAGSSSSSLISGTGSGGRSGENTNPNPAITPTVNNAMQNLVLPPQNQFQPSQNVLPNQMSDLNNNGSGNGNIIQPEMSPYPPPNVQFSPLNEQQLQNMTNGPTPTGLINSFTALQQQQLSQSMPPQNGPPPLAPQPPSQPQQQQQQQQQSNSRNSSTFQNYSGIQDNLFQNDDNPLDEVFIRNYQSLNVLNGSNGLVNVNNFPMNPSNSMTEPSFPPGVPLSRSGMLAKGGSPFNVMNSPIMNSVNIGGGGGGVGGTGVFNIGANIANATASYMNLNLTSTASSSSPTNTNESNTSPKTLSDFHFATKMDTYELKLLNHAEKANIEKNKHIFIDTLIFESILRCLKTVERESIEEIFKNCDHGKVAIEDRLSYYLHMYWLVFHPQFSIIHKPSFNTKFIQPLLLISMIIIGCHYSSPELDECMAKKLMKSPEYRFSILITTPLRYMIFQHEDFKSPVKLWILQSLNMIEWVEKNFLSRRMHERAHLHHGTTVQLLRRSPLLGGNPTVNMKKSASSTSGSSSSAGEDESEEAVVHELNGGAAATDGASGSPTSKSGSNNPSNDKNNTSFDSTDSELFLRWVESESMKRVTFLTFYLDTIDYIKFRHPPQIMFYQLQLLNLPCDDDCLWESNDVNESFKKVVKKQRKLQQQQKHDDDNNTDKNVVKIRNGESFLSVLKKLLKPYKPRETLLKLNLSRFSKKILLAGLVAIMYQMQQTDLQSSSSLLTSNGIVQTNAHRSKIWKEIILKAFDNWHFELLASFTNTPLSLTDKVFKDVDSNLIPSPMLHLSQIIGFADINHYDIAIFGGSPANMSVNATMKDHYIVQRKLNNIWGKGVVNSANNNLNATSSKKSINEIINIRGVVHCYLLLWHLMLRPLEDDDDNCCNTKADFVDWKACPDYFDSMYAVSISTLVLWSYVFSTLGLESSKFGELETDDEKILHQKSYEELAHLSAEGGYEYLSRIRENYITHLKRDKDFLLKEFTIHPIRFIQKNPDKNEELKTKYTPHEILNKYGDILPLVTNKQNISGLCFLVGTRLLCSQWQVIRENAKLILNCGYRSIGKKNILCLDLFDNEFTE